MEIDNMFQQSLLKNQNRHFISKIDQVYNKVNGKCNKHNHFIVIILLLKALVPSVLTLNTSSQI